MKNAAKQVLRRATTFLGHGDPAGAKIWFIGLEPLTPVRSRAELKAIPDRPWVTQNGCPGTSTAVYAIISKLVTRLNGDSSAEAWRAYRDGRLFAPGSEAFLANLYPLGKRIEIDWPVQYERWLGMSRREYYRWLQLKGGTRFEYIRQQRLERGNPLTICFGKGHWGHFARCLGIENEPYRDVGRFRCYKRARVVMTEFFRFTRMPDESIVALCAWLCRENLNPIRGGRSRRKGL